MRTIEKICTVEFMGSGLGKPTNVHRLMGHLRHTKSLEVINLDVCEPLFVYILSDEPVQANDWYMVYDTNGIPSVYQCRRRELDRVYYDGSASDLDSECHKIIATDDERLTVGGAWVKSIGFLGHPTPTQDWFKMYCQNPTQTVLVEYQMWPRYTQYDTGFIPLVDENNTIRMRKNEPQTYNEHEVKELVKKALDGYQHQNFESWWESNRKRTAV